MGTLADSVWIVPAASSGLLIAVIVLMTVGSVLGVLGYRFWQRRNDQSKERC